MERLHRCSASIVWQEQPFEMRKRPNTLGKPRLQSDQKFAQLRYECILSLGIICLLCMECTNELGNGLTVVVSFFLFFSSEFQVCDAVLMMLRRHGVLASTISSTFSFKFQDMRYSGVIVLVVVWNSNVSTSILLYMVS